MGIKYIQGDIIKALINHDIDILAHGVNCSGGFGSGIAGQITKHFPKVRAEYLNKFNTEGWGLGQIQIVNNYGESEDYQHMWAIANCATQNLYGRNPTSQPNHMYCSYEAIREVMVELYEIVNEDDRILGIPRIGCGLAGGNWNEVEKIIEKIFGNITICVYSL